MKITLTKKQREASRRILDRVKKMCKAGLFVLAASYLTNTAVFDVVNEQIKGGQVDQEYLEETAFIDQYGDLEDLIEQRRLQMELSGQNSILQGARATQEFAFDEELNVKLLSETMKNQYLESTVRIREMNAKAIDPDNTDFVTKTYVSEIMPFGYVEEFYGTQRCTSPMMIPGTSLMNSTLMGIVLLITLGYLFVGIAIISDIFMEAIEAITETSYRVEYWDAEKTQHITVERKIWNATIANLSLMALGSSAPEILLSVISSVKDIEAVPPELGPSTIVGSAAFNLLVISGVSIIAVGGEDNDTKQIDDLWVFAVTSLFSLWAYIWLWICVDDGYITVTEGILTCVFFILLLAISYTADRVNAYRVSQRMSQDEKREKEEEDLLRIKKDKLRAFGRAYSDNAVIECAQGLTAKEANQMPEETKKEINKLFEEIFNVSDSKEIPVSDLLAALQPEKLLERFAYRKRNATNAKEFVRIKGTQGQLEHDEDAKRFVKEENDMVGFKCLHYSVTESNGHVEITIVKKMMNQEIFVGVRTIDDTAVSPKDYKEVIQEVKFEKRQLEKTIQIPIVDDEEWNPDLEFWVELFDPLKQEQGYEDRLPGDDTRCKVTILDEDFPGTIGFGNTDIRVSKGAQEVEIEVERVDGSDGTIGCMISTEPLTMEPTPQSAQEFEDYLPKHEKIQFKHNETSQKVIIKLVNEKIGNVDDNGKDFGKEFEDEANEGEDGSEEGEPDLIFKVKLDKPEPNGVKISKKNVCLVTLVRSEEEDKNAASQRKLIEFYLAMADPSWSQQFKNAVLLGPVIDEEDHELTEVDGYEAFFHFLQIGWKVAFATCPPSSIWGGGPCFFISLAYIGAVTYVVGEVATVLGCVLYIKESVASITLVALGTSLPDTFASMTAAKASDNADAAVGNITGSNAVNVFLGCGLPWAVCSIYHTNNISDNGYKVKAGPLAFSVIVFLVVAIVCFIVLVFRRIMVGGELGGTPVGRYSSGCFLFFLWFIYILMSTLQAYDIIKYPGGDKLPA